MRLLIERTNVIGGAIVTLLASVFGQYWFLFAGFFVLNVVDYLTGCIKARYYEHNESSAVGAKGIAKKVFYWVVIEIAFFISICFKRMGDMFGIDLSFVVMFGWFTLASYLINEIRSILENFVIMGVEVPDLLIRGLDVTEKLLKNSNHTGGEQDAGN